MVVGSRKHRPRGAELWVSLTWLPPAGPTNLPEGAIFQRKVSGQNWLKFWSLALLNEKRLFPGGTLTCHKRGLQANWKPQQPVRTQRTFRG